MSPRHIFITGGSGFIGSRVCRKLAEQDFELTVLTRDVANAKARLPAKVTLVERLEQLKVQPSIDAVINLAGEPLADRRWSEKRKQLFYSSRVGTTENLFRHFSQEGVTPPEVLISGSAIGSYGPKGDEPIDESAGGTACFSSELCRAWESMACQFENLGTRVCLVRTGVVLGEGGGALQAMLPAFRFGLGGPIGHGEQWMSWIHMDDMVEVIYRALTDASISGAINATAPNPVTNRDFARTLGRVLSRPALIPMPAILVRMLFGEMADELLLSGQRVVPEKLLQRQFSFYYPELEPALSSILKRH